MVTPTMPVGGIRPAGGTGTSSPVEPADLVIRNGKIYTGHAAQPVATSVAVKDGVFTAVGDDATIAPHVGPGTHPPHCFDDRPLGIRNSREQLRE